MGIRFSASTTPATAAAAAATSACSAKVITISGALREYTAAPLPASIVLADCEPPEAGSSCFLCNADSLSFEDPIPAVAPDDPVLPGRLYFVLPDGMRRRPLSGAEMGALAVKASKALEASAAAGKGGRCGRKKQKKRKGRTVKVSPLVDYVVGTEEGFGGDGCGAGGERTAAVVVVSSVATRGGVAQRKGAAVGDGQRKGLGAGGSRRFGRRGGSFRGRLGTIEEEASE